MATYDNTSALPINPNQVTCYTPTGHYYAGQRILHQDFGPGTITQVHHDNIRVVMDQDPDQSGEKKARRFQSASLTVEEAMTANYFYDDDILTLLDWYNDDLTESRALLGQGFVE